MFVIAKYNAGAYEMTGYAFSSVVDAQAFMGVMNMPSFSHIIVELTPRMKAA